MPSLRNVGPEQERSGAGNGRHPVAEVAGRAAVLKALGGSRGGLPCRGHCLPPPAVPTLQVQVEVDRGGCGEATDVLPAARSEVAAAGDRTNLAGPGEGAAGRGFQPGAAVSWWS